MNADRAALASAIEVSVVIPCYNEEDNAVPIADAVAIELQAANANYEIIFIDNASSDKTVGIIAEMCARDPRIKLIVNTRNFGQMRSPTHAIYQAQGQAVIGMCADFQDPPALLGKLIARWREGAKIVLGVRASEKTSVQLNIFRRLGYGFLEQFADYKVIPGATGFGIYDRRVVDELARWREPEPFFRGMLVESGFPIEVIPYDRPERAGGLSKNNLSTLLAFGLSGLASSSKNLLRLPFYAAVLTTVLGLATFLGGLVSWVAGGPLAIWILALLLEGLFALLFVSLGFVGEQIRLIAERSRETPLVIEKARINF